MIGRRGFGLLTAGAALSVVGAVGSLRADRGTGRVPAAAGPLLPGLVDRLDRVASVTVARPRGEVSLARAGKGWTVASRHGYPADDARVAGLLDSLARLTRETALTARPELWPRLGLGEPGTPRPEREGSVERENEPGTRVTLRDATGTVLADVILGPAAPPRPTPDGGRGPALYARLVAGERAWRAGGAVDLPRAALDWLDRRLVDLPAARLDRLTVEGTDGAAVTLARGPDGTLAPATPLPGGAPADPRAVSLLADAFEALDLADVRPAGDGGPDAALVAVARATAAEGLAVEARQTGAADDPAGRWCRFIVETAPEASPAARSEAEALRRRLDAWTYRLPAHRARRLATTDLTGDPA
ncbi:MAG: DUF4340 domain-containing protein [Azospirillaceae bacterium]